MSTTPLLSRWNPPRDVTSPLPNEKRRPQVDALEHARGRRATERLDVLAWYGAQLAESQARIELQRQALLDQQIDALERRDGPHLVLDGLLQGLGMAGAVGLAGKTILESQRTSSTTAPMAPSIWLYPLVGALGVGVAFSVGADRRDAQVFALRERRLQSEERELRYRYAAPPPTQFTRGEPAPGQPRR